MTKGFIYGAVASLLATAAVADGVTGSAEYAFEAETFTFTAGYEATMPFGLILRPELEADYVRANEEFDFNGFSLDAIYPLNRNTNAYIELDTDDELKYDELTAGVSFKF